MSESLQEWFSENPTDDNIVIRDYLTNLISLDDAASRLVQSLQEKITSSRNANNALSAVLEVIADIAAEFPRTHEALVPLLGRLKSHSSPTDFDRVFIYTLDERWLRYGTSAELRSEELAHPIDDWTNLNRFAALAHKEGVQDLSRFARDTLDMAWRRDGWRVEWGATGLSDDIIALEGHAPAAAQWVIICGQRLYHESSQIEQKWAGWTHDLSWIVEQEGLNESTRLLCRQALQEMQQIAK
ncbi:hypothetical protein H0H93_000641 [Arthromyces matolae]|nr:hypothetical protein H0H93_000641 [Arthromyces matolae]